jgi:hypothetical protein
MTSALCSSAEFGFWIVLSVNVMIAAVGLRELHRFSKAHAEAERLVNDAHKFRAQALAAKDVWKSAKLDARNR